MENLITSACRYNEFFLQGDQERKLGLKYSAELMDRSKMPEIPRMQVDFYSFIVIPAFEILYGFLGAPVKPLYDSVIENQGQWRKLKDLGVPYHFDSKFSD